MPNFMIDGLLSCSLPEIRPPTGRGANAIAKTPNAARREAKGSSAGKNSLVPW
jgi:hypothetical protein